MKIASKIFYRSFLLQAVWNYERMQNIGFLYTIYPKLKELYSDNISMFKDACKRHITYFNTHPYMSLFIFGYVVQQEERIKDGNIEAIEEMNRFKLQMAGPLAAMGDKLFWSTWRPLMGLFGVFLFYAGLTPKMLIPIVFILAYNIPIYFHKRRSLVLALKGGSVLSDSIKNMHNNFFLNMIPVLGLTLIAAVILIVFFTEGLGRGILFVLFAALTIFLRKCCNLSATKMLYLISAIVIIGSLIIK